MLPTIPPAVALLIVYGVVLTSCASESSNISKLHRIRRQSQDTQEAGCKLPPPQLNGKFSPSKWRCPSDDTNQPLCQMTPGNLVPQNWPIFHSCDPGYALNATSPFSICLDEQWRPALPRCIRVCPPPIRTHTFLIGPGPFQDWMLRWMKCVFRGQEVSCDSDARPGTVAKASCPQFYRSNMEMTCMDDGNWAKLNRSSLIETQMVPYRTNHTGFSCVPECGLISKVENSGENATNSSPTSVSEYPWVAGVYRKDLENGYTLICVGSLITDTFVITVASCLENHEPEELRVSLGKFYRDFYQVESSSAIHEVREVFFYDSHNGSTTANGTDVALLRLLLKAQVSSYIMPICVDWNHIYPIPNDIMLTEKEPIQEANGRISRIIAYKQEHNAIINCTKDLRQLTNESLTANNSCGGILIQGYLLFDGVGVSVTYDKEDRHFLMEYQSVKYIKEEEIELNYSIDLQVTGLSKWLQEKMMDDLNRMI